MKTLKEKVDKLMNGCSIEEAEEIGIEIFAQLIAKKVYSEKDKSYVPDLFKRICIAADKWARDHSFEMALASAASKINLDKSKK